MFTDAQVGCGLLFSPASWCSGADVNSKTLKCNVGVYMYVGIICYQSSLKQYKSQIKFSYIFDVFGVGFLVVVSLNKYN